MTQELPVRVGIVVGSRSDINAAQRASAVLGELGVDSEIRVISAHRAPDLLAGYVASAEERGIRVFIAMAGLAAHLPGVIASQTTRTRSGGRPKRCVNVWRVHRTTPATIIVAYGRLWHTTKV